MNGIALGDAIKTAINAKMTARIGQPYLALPPEFKNDFIASIAEAVAEQVVLHIQTTGVVTTVVSSNPPPAPVPIGTGLGTVL